MALTLAMVFPGQGSQSVGMQAALAKEFPVVEEVYSIASDVLGYDLWDLVQAGPSEKLGQTTVTQPAMLAAGYAAFRAWQAAGGGDIAQMAGHSLGEYTALVAAGAVDFADAMRVVVRRAELMENAVPNGIGGMAAILGLDDATIISVCDEASMIGIAEPVNFNSPGQVVIAGHKDALDRAIVEAKAAGARRAIILPVSVPSHSSLMINAGLGLRDALDEVKFSEPNITVLGASNGTPYGDGENIRRRLETQVFGAVQWVLTVKTMIDNGATKFVECGPGKVLAGLCRRIDRSVSVGFIDSDESLQKAIGL